MSALRVLNLFVFVRSLAFVFFVVYVTLRASGHLSVCLP